MLRCRCARIVRQTIRMPDAVSCLAECAVCVASASRHAWSGPRWERADDGDWSSAHGTADAPRSLKSDTTRQSVQSHRTFEVKVCAMSSFRVMANVQLRSARTVKRTFTVHRVSLWPGPPRRGSAGWAMERAAPSRGSSAAHPDDNANRYTQVRHSHLIIR